MDHQSCELDPLVTGHLSLGDYNHRFLKCRNLSEAIIRQFTMKGCNELPELWQICVKAFHHL